VEGGQLVRSAVLKPLPFLLWFLRKNCQGQQSSCRTNFDCWQFWGKSSGVGGKVGGRLFFRHSLPYHCQIALTYCCYRPCRVFLGPCDCQNVASRFPIRLKAIENPKTPSCFCQEMSPIKPLALRLALSGLIIKRFAHLIASVYRPVDEHGNEFPFAAGHFAGCRMSFAMSLLLQLMLAFLIHICHWREDKPSGNNSEM